MHSVADEANLLTQQVLQTPPDIYYIYEPSDLDTARTQSRSLLLPTLSIEMVYHTIVKSIASKNFEAVNEHDYEAILAGCS